MDNVLSVYKQNRKEYRIFNLLIQSSAKNSYYSKMAEECQKIFKYNFSILHNGIDKKKIQK